MPDNDKLSQLFTIVRFSIVQPTENGKVVYRKKLPFSLFYISFATLFVILFSFYNDFTFINKNIVDGTGETIESWGAYGIVFLFSVLTALFLFRPKTVNKSLFGLVPIFAVMYVLTFIFTELNLPIALFFQLSCIFLLAITNGFLFVSVLEMLAYTLGGYERLICFATFSTLFMCIVFLNNIITHHLPFIGQFIIPMGSLLVMYISMFILDKSSYSSMEMQNEKTHTILTIFTLLITFTLGFSTFSFIVLRDQNNLNTSILHPDNMRFYAGIMSATFVSIYIFFKSKYSSVIYLALWWLVAIATYQSLSAYLIGSNNNDLLLRIVEFLMGAELGLSVITFLSFVGRLLEERASLIALRLFVFVTTLYLALLLFASQILSSINILYYVPLIQSLIFCVGVVFIGVFIIAWNRNRSLVEKRTRLELEEVARKKSLEAEKANAALQTVVEEAKKQLKQRLENQMKFQEIAEETFVLTSAVSEDKGFDDGVVDPAETLSDKEMVVFEQLIKGFTLRQVAGELRMKYDTVNYHYKNIYRKLNVCSKIELYMRYSNYRKK